MTSSETQPGTGWTITDQQPDQKVGPGNTVVDGITIWFRTQFNAQSSVWLPMTSYTADQARQAITSLATTMDSVHMLTG
jgi:hypothetical protein